MTLEYEDRDRESVLRDLTCEDEEVRRLAVERVSVLPIEEAIPHLVERIGDTSWRVRKSAVERLVACPAHESVVAALVAALGDGENTGRRNSGVEALVECGGAAVPQLLAAMTSDDSDVRKLVVDALAGIGDERSIPELIARRGDPDPNVRAAIADALGAIGGEAAATALSEIAVSVGEDQLVRFSALHAMAAIEAPVMARDLGPVLEDSVLRPAGLALLGRVADDEAIAVLAKALGSNARSVREAAIGSFLRMLSRIDGVESDRLVERIREAALAAPQAVENAISRLPDATLPVRLMLVQFLGLVRSDAAVLPMLVAAQDEALSMVALTNLEGLGEIAEDAIEAHWSELDANSKRDACRLFGRMRGEQSASRLLACLDSPSPEIRCAAAESIGLRGIVDGLPLLLRRLESAAQEDDFEAEEEIGLITESMIELAKPDHASGSEAVTEQAIAMLTSSLEGAAKEVRLAIAQVIGRIGRHRDAQVIEFLLKDPSSQVRRAAVDALAHLDPGTAAESLRLALADEASIVRIAAANALGASGSEEVVDVLRCLADDEDRDVRAAAVRALGVRLNTVNDVAQRSQVLQVIDTALGDEAIVALAAIEAMRGMGGSAVEPVAMILDRSEPEVVLEAVRCLGTSMEPSILENLLPLISHPDWMVRAEAIQVLSDRSVAKAVPALLRRLETEQDDFVRDAMLRALDRLGG
jgi:HEAT repeat protein